MTRAVPLLLLALLLSGVLAWELGGADTSSDPVTRPASTPASMRNGAVAAATAPDRAAEVAALLNRPLFDPGRRPPSRPVTPGAPPASVVLPRVSGVLVSAAGRSAIFSLPGTDKALVAHEGGRVGDFTVQSISSGEVTLLGPDGPAVLRPTLRKDLPPPAPVAAPMPGFPQPGVPQPGFPQPGFPQPGILAPGTPPP